MEFLASTDSGPVFDFALLLLDRREMGSKDIVRGFGGVRSPTSTVSMRFTFRSHDEVAAIEVGRVIVDLITYEIVPRSNYIQISNALWSFRGILAGSGAGIS